MHVRDATPADLHRVVEVHEAAVDDVVDRSSDGGAYDRSEVAGWDRDRRPGDYQVGDPDRPTVVAVRNGDVVGFGGLDVPRGELRAVYVHPDHARSGVGTALRSHLEGRAARRGVTTLELLATLNAVDFYRSAGYETVRETTVELSRGSDQPVVELRKRLRDPSGEAWGRLPA